MRGQDYLHKGKSAGIKKWFGSTTWLQRGIWLIMIFCLLPFWPLGLVREVEEERSGDSGHGVTEEMIPGTGMIQTFRAEHSQLKKLDFVLNYDESQGREGTILFELLDEKDGIVYQEEIPYSQIDQYTYHTVSLDIELKKHHIYKYCLTNLDITENIPRVVYTVEEQMHAAPNREMTFAGETVDGQSLTRYTWNRPLRYYNVMAVAGLIGCAGFTLTELAGQKGKKNPSGEDG